jgi:hypothetical protein
MIERGVNPEALAVSAFDRSSTTGFHSQLMMLSHSK